MTRLKCPKTEVQFEEIDSLDRQKTTNLNTDEQIIP